jgi:hypothetical protein
VSPDPRDLWTSDDCARWSDALAQYEASVAARGERLPALDAWYRNELPTQIAGRVPPHLTAPELVRIAEWKMKRGVWRGRNLALIRRNDDAAVVLASGQAFAASEPRAAVNHLCALEGVGPATASAVLAAGRPALFPFFDEDAAAVAVGPPVAFTVPYYLRYAEALRARAVDLSRGCPGSIWTPELVGRALWAAHRVQSRPA